MLAVHALTLDVAHLPRNKMTTTVKQHMGELMHRFLLAILLVALFNNPYAVTRAQVELSGSTIPPKIILIRENVSTNDDRITIYIPEPENLESDVQTINLSPLSFGIPGGDPILFEQVHQAFLNVVRDAPPGTCYRFGQVNATLPPECDRESLVPGPLDTFFWKSRGISQNIEVYYGNELISVCPATVSRCEITIELGAIAIFALPDGGEMIVLDAGAFVTNDEYSQFNSGYECAPRTTCEQATLVDITLESAQAYCAWVGGQLPTLDQLQIFHDNEFAIDFTGTDDDIIYEWTSTPVPNSSGDVYYVVGVNEDGELVIDERNKEALFLSDIAFRCVRIF